ncbi:hypothetical protein V6N13_048497 [Hibiscus sabdariffa]|uniref:Uncharacterized protein n=1 Tax=Hibiscus sabdariffa TaxID=183260 RepID=A0ABR2F7D8_9ROSI
MRYKLGQSIPLRRTLLFLTSLGRRASYGAFVPYFFIYYISLKVGSPESEERSSPMRREERPRHPHATDKQRSELLAKGVVSLGLSERAHSPPPALAQ